VTAERSRDHFVAENFAQGSRFFRNYNLSKAWCLGKGLYGLGTSRLFTPVWRRVRGELCVWISGDVLIRKGWIEMIWNWCQRPVKALKSRWGRSGQRDSGSQLVLSNLENAMRCYGRIGSMLRAQSFVTDDQVWGLESVSLPLMSKQRCSARFQLCIYDHNASGDVPGSCVAILQGEWSPLVAGTYVFTGQGLKLKPSTKYWIVATAGEDGCDSYQWAECGRDYTSAGPWSLPGIGSAIWAESPAVGVSWESFDDAVYLFAIRASLVGCSVAGSDIPQLAFR
jgi:hypothetical protein